MARFGTDGYFSYTNDPTTFVGGTTFALDASQMPEYPFEEYRITDKTTVRNLNGDAYTYQNYAKNGYLFRWSLLDEAKVNDIKRMVAANPILIWSTNGTIWGTYLINGNPKFEEVQFEMYTVELDLQER
jgi:hypothetical protein